MFRTLLTLALLLTPAVAHADWYEAGTEHFIIVSDEKPERLAQFATDLERYDRAMRVFHSVPDYPVAPVNRVTVYVVADINTMSEMFGGEVAGIYMGRAGGSVSFTPKRGYAVEHGSLYKQDPRTLLDPLPVLRHEYAHHFMFSNWDASALPLWYTEGYAELHATAMFQPDGSIVFGQVPMYRAVELRTAAACTAKDIVSTAKLDKLNNCGPTEFYAKGWLITHYFSLAPGGSDKLAAYLNALNDGQPMEKAAALLGDLDTLDATLGKHLASKTLPAFTVPADKLKIAAPTLRKLTPGEAALMPVRLHSKAGVDKDEAQSVYLRAVSLAKPFPNDVGAQLVLAEAAFDAKHYDVVDEATGRAIAADPKSSKALLYRGMGKMAVAAAAKSKDPAVWKEVRRWFIAAAKVDPNDAEPLIGFYRSFLMAGEKPTKNATDGIYQAVDLSPEAAELRLMVAFAYLSEGKAKEARATLTPVAYDPHPDLRTKFAKLLIGLIDAGKADEVMAKIAPFVIDPDTKLKPDQPKPADPKKDDPKKGDKPSA